MKQIGFAVLMLSVLAACDPANPPVSGEVPKVQSTPDLASCGGEAYQYLTGQKGTALERVLIMREVRVIRPGSLVTTDYKPTRLNFEINSAGLIARVFCG